MAFTQTNPNPNHLSQTLPYFDSLLQRLESDDKDVSAMFGLNIHWGYWEHPERAMTSASDFSNASRAMTRKVYSHADIHDGMRILDAGCGFGGTLFELNEHFSNLDLVGLNIDERQIHRARGIATPKKKNQIQFVVGDACQLPFPDQSFDRVLAVECIFHFPSRLRFLREAFRVLKKGGRLVVSDLVVYAPSIPILAVTAIPSTRARVKIYGSKNSATTRTGYRWMSKWVGFSRCKGLDITKNTLPTYRALEKVEDSLAVDPRNKGMARRANRFLEWVGKRGFFQYTIFEFLKT